MNSIKNTNVKEPLNIDRKLIKQSELARRTGYSEMYISYILRGLRKNDTLLEEIRRIIRELSKAA